MVNYSTLYVRFGGYGWMVEQGPKNRPIIIAGPFATKSLAQAAKKRLSANARRNPEVKALPRGRFVKVTAIKVSRDGKRLSIKFPGSVKRKAATKKRKR